MKDLNMKITAAICKLCNDMVMYKSWPSFSRLIEITDSITTYKHKNKTSYFRNK